MKVYKESADQAKLIASQVYEQINDNEYGLQNLSNKINNLKFEISPRITKTSAPNNATATLGNSINIIIDAEDATLYRVKANDLPTGIDEWSEENIVSVEGLISGANTIHVQATNDSGKITNSRITIFKI